MPQATVEQLVGIARAHQTQLLAVRDRTSAALAALWARVVTDPTDATAEQWIASSVPVVAAVQRITATAALSFIATYVAAATGNPVETSELSPSDFLDPRGTPLVEVLQRPIILMRTLTAGMPIDQAIAAGQTRAAQIGATDPMLSARAASSAAMTAEPRIVGYRRVPDAKACKFCVLVATQRYHDSDLMAIHPSCGCTVAPIVGDRDPGRVLDRGLVDQLMAADPALGKRGGNRAKARQLAANSLDKANDLTAVHVHGELGPTLYAAGTKFATAP